MDGIYITRAELEALEDAEGVLVKGYLWLRSRMDLRTGMVGRVTGISHVAVAEHCEYVVRKGQGFQRFRLGDTPKAIKEGGRRVLERLENLGLIVKQGGALLCFLCPLARYASVRPNQTGHYRATPLPTERATPALSSKSGSDAGFEGFESQFSPERDSLEIKQHGANGPHIGVQGLYPSQSSSTVLTGVGADRDENAGGLIRDRAAPSQACPLERTGKNEKDLNRDRAAPSEAGDPARPLGTLSDLRQNDALVGFPENESAPPNALSAPISGIAALVEVLNRRAVRVPTKPDVLRGWVAMGVTPLELDIGIERALAERVKAGSQQRLNVGYIASIIQTARSEARRAADAARQAVARRRRGDTGADMAALAKQLGIAGARPGESLADFRVRVLAAAGDAVGAGRE
jgi:hypothetical protein